MGNEWGGYGFSLTFRFCDRSSVDFQKNGGVGDRFSMGLKIKVAISERLRYIN
jgi:hypothetical protein